MEQVTRLELASSAWKAAALPLCYTCKWCPALASNENPLLFRQVCRPTTPTGHGFGCGAGSRNRER